ncbi:uncharacterized protein LOC141701322 [Apium graveolens]|uniref:uncharacterized protein LOC141701322 n=1 Tax=Apium graveolens TaxID=4045 RepID=UPI003D7BEA2B
MKIIHNPGVSGKLVNWVVELSQFNLSFIPRTAIKVRALTDFIIECNFLEDEPRPMSIDPESGNDHTPGAWALKVDGSSMNERSGAGLILKSPDGFTIQTAISFGFSATNNQAEYEALIAGLKLAKTLRIQDLNIYSDSQIVVKQTNGEYIAMDPVLAKYQALVQSYLTSIPRSQVLQIYREENSEADNLFKLVQNSSDLDCSVYFEELQKPEFESYLQEWGIKHKKSSVAYPQGNGQVEVTNRILLWGIEKRLRQSKSKWPEELSNILWAYKTSPRTSTGETPFKLAYGTEAMLPIEVRSPSHRAINFDEPANEEGLRINIELIDEVRDQAVARMEKYKEKTKENFSKKSRVKNFQVGDPVHRDTEASDLTNSGKLMPKWEGSYRIKEVLRPGT